MESHKIKEILQEALYFWWLRPENGLAIASYCLNGFSLKPNPGEIAADFACGDGVSTFFKCGGRFEHIFDIFRGGANINEMSHIVDKNIDVFDYVENQYTPKIKLRPDVKYSFGTDHKSSLLAKAKKLKFYSNLLQEDFSKESIIENNSLDFAYCNSLYWVSDPSRAVKYIVQKVKSGGLIVFDVFTTEKYKLDFRNLYPKADPFWQAIMNRGRMENNPGLKNELEWEIIFKNSNLDIQETRNILPSGIIKFWNYGLRPILPALMLMVKNITEDNLIKIKNEWVANWTKLLLPVLKNPENFTKDNNRYRIQYVLKKK